MSETPSAVAIRVVRSALIAADIASGRIYLHRADPKSVKPYVVMSPAPATPNNWSSRRDFGLELNIKAVSESMAEAVAVADAIRQAITDRGVNDRFGGIDSPEWKFLSISEGMQFSLIDPLENASPLYLEGAIYIINMEEYNASICG